MAFNVGKFVKSAAKSIGSRMLEDIVTAASSKLPLNTVLAARSTADSLFNIGASYESISAFSTQKTDSLIRDNAETYFALAGKDPARASAAGITDLRRGAVNSDTNFHLNEINPTTKIRGKKRESSDAFVDLTPNEPRGDFSRKVDLPGSSPVPNRRVDLPGSSPLPKNPVPLP